MSYDGWKTRDPNHGIGDYDHCSTCGAHYTEPCQAPTPCGYDPVPVEMQFHAWPCPRNGEAHSGYCEVCGGGETGALCAPRPAREPAREPETQKAIKPQQN